MSTIIQSSNQREFNSLCKDKLNDSVINFKSNADYTYHNHVHAWTNGNVVITHNELFESFALEIFE